MLQGFENDEVSPHFHMNYVVDDGERDMKRDYNIELLMTIYGEILSYWVINFESYVMVIKSGYFERNAKSFTIKNKTKSCT